MNWFFWCVLAFSVPLVLCEVEPAEEEVPKVVLSESFSSSTSKPGLPTSDGTQGTEIPGGLGFFHGFIASLSVIIVSEIGDKTFFIAAIMAMKRSRLTVFAGAMSALAFMTVLSVFFGWAATIIPRAYTYYASTALFAIFGLKMLYEGYKTTKNQNLVELEDVKAELYANDLKYESHGVLLDDGESGGTAARSPQERRLWFLAVSRFFIQAFTLTFLAEWGDRSQLATIILAARENVYGVTFGGIVGHSICTGIAVVGGRAIAQKISVRTVTLIGGVVFLLFAFSALFFDPNAP